MGKNSKKKRSKVGLVQYEDQPCDFCHESSLDELRYGKMYHFEATTVHYFCVNCYYCGLKFANIKCCYPNCPIAFHLPCGLRNNSMALFFGQFNSLCENHRRHQTIPIEIYESREELLWPRIVVNKLNFPISSSKTKKKIKGLIKFKSPFSCSICMEEVYPFPSAESFWSPCCRKDKWFHRICVSKLALSAGKHFIKCPLCNNQKDFLAALQEFGFYIPDQDASWELENAAFQDLLFRPKTCYIENCICPKGKKFKDRKRWKLIICSTCGSQAAHQSCIDGKNGLICDRCILSVPSPSSQKVVIPSTISMVPKSQVTPRIKAVSPRKTPVKFTTVETVTSLPNIEEGQLRRGRKRYRLAKNPANVAFLNELPENSMKKMKTVATKRKILQEEEDEIKPIKIKSELIDDFEKNKIMSSNPEDELLKSIKQEKMDPDIKKPCVNNLHSWLGLNFNVNNINNKTIKRKRKKKTKLSPNTIEKYFINKSEEKEREDLVSVKKEPESPKSSKKSFCTQLFFGFKNFI